LGISILSGFLLMLVLHAQLPVGGRVVAIGDFGDTLPLALNARLQTLTDKNSADLASNGRVLKPKAQLSPDLAWPLRPRPPFNQYDYHGVSNFVDHDARYPGFVQDYSCGTRTYDQASGYNHAGTDYYLWPFPWLMMDQAQVEIVAAAPGVLIDSD